VNGYRKIEEKTRVAHVLMTAGPTRENLDPIRFLSNASSGRMAVAISQALVDRGHRVTVVSGPVQVAYPAAVEVVWVQSTQEMLEAAVAVVPSADGVVAVAAPCDFRPARYSDQKIKKSRDRPTWTLELVPTPDILSALRLANPDAWLVGFALETEAGLENAVEKRRQKQCDLIVLNQAEAIGGTETAIRLIDASDRCVASFQGPKPGVAADLVEWIQQHLIGQPLAERPGRST